MAPNWRCCSAGAGLLDARAADVTVALPIGEMEPTGGVPVLAAALSGRLESEEDAWVREEIDLALEG